MRAHSSLVSLSVGMLSCLTQCWHAVLSHSVLACRTQQTSRTSQLHVPLIIKLQAQRGQEVLDDDARVVDLPPGQACMEADCLPAC